MNKSEYNALLFSEGEISLLSEDEVNIFIALLKRKAKFSSEKPENNVVLQNSKTPKNVSPTLCRSKPVPYKLSRFKITDICKPENSDEYWIYIDETKKAIIPLQKLGNLSKTADQSPRTLIGRFISCYAQIKNNQLSIKRSKPINLVSSSRFTNGTDKIDKIDKIDKSVSLNEIRVLLKDNEDFQFLEELKDFSSLKREQIEQIAGFCWERLYSKIYKGWTFRKGAGPYDNTKNDKFVDNKCMMLGTGANKRLLIPEEYIKEGDSRYKILGSSYPDKIYFDLATAELNKSKTAFIFRRKGFISYSSVKKLIESNQCKSFDLNENKRVYPIDVNQLSQEIL